MGKYLGLQLKRLSRVLVWSVPLMAVLLACLVLGAVALIAALNADDSRLEFPIGLVGVPDSGTLRLGLSAIDSLDDLGVAVEFVELSAEEAPQALEDGRVKAYVVIPEGFVSAANHGQLKTIEYVSAPQAAGINALFEQEVTAIISQVLLQSEKASFGSYAALEPELGHEEANRVMDQLSQELAQFIFLRNRTGSVEILGFDRAPGFGTYLAAGIAVTMALLICLSFAPIGVQQNLGVNILLRSQGRSDILQGVIDYFTLFFGEIATIFVLLLGAGAFAPKLALSVALRFLPVAAMAASLGFLCFGAMRSLLGGLLAYFFAAVSLAFVCGCIYPAWFFPESVQRLAQVLPAGLARSFLLGSNSALLPLLGYTAVFVALGVMLRVRRIRAGEVSL